MTDRVFEAFLKKQQEEAIALSEASDLLHLFPAGEPANRYVAQFRCKGLVQHASGEIVDADRFEVGIWFPDNYLRAVNPFQVLTWLGPRRVWHPNISGENSVVCAGRLAPGTGLVDILYQLFEIITWQKVTMREDDALHWAACEFARQHQDRFPVDRRPLKRRVLALGNGELREPRESNGHVL
jgi:hypothetical protein